jgi:L-Ala-D/L-Glu epimerase
MIAKVFEAPLSQPFRIATGQHNSLRNVLFRIETKRGVAGYGEAAVATHITGETVEGTLANLRQVGSELEGRKLSDIGAISRWLHERLPSNMCAVAAVEMALYDCKAREMGVPLWRLFGTSAKKLSTDITIVIAPLAETQITCRRFYAQGFRKFKIKIGKDYDLDLKRVAAVKRIAPRCELYLDANQAFTAEGILRFLKDLECMKITPALLEQPVAKADWDGLKEVSRKTKIPVCADESASSLEDCRRIIKEKACPAVNIKLMKTGLVDAERIANLCVKSGIELMIGAMMETSLATTASAHLACGLGCFRYIDIDTAFFIKQGFDHPNPYLSSRGVYDLRWVPAGIGIIPDCFVALRAPRNDV